jgi:ribosomal protein S18 acetylase RimI-like enzyme
MITRESTPSDTSVFVDVLVDCFPDKFSVIFGNKLNCGVEVLLKYYGQPNGLAGAFVAEENSQIAGIIKLKTTDIPQSNGSLWMLRGLGVLGAFHAFFALLILEQRVGENECYVETLAVEPAFRGKGVGKQLLMRGEEFAQEHHKTVYSLYVASDNTAARQLYRSLGFLEVKTRSSIFAKHFLGKRTFILMQKQLST